MNRGDGIDWRQSNIPADEKVRYCGAGFGFRVMAVNRLMNAPDSLGGRQSGQWKIADVRPKIGNGNLNRTPSGITELDIMFIVRYSEVRKKTTKEFPCLEILTPGSFGLPGCSRLATRMTTNRTKAPDPSGW